jgi:VanZ family protein
VLVAVALWAGCSCVRLVCLLTLRQPLLHRRWWLLVDLLVVLQRACWASTVVCFEKCGLGCVCAAIQQNMRCDVWKHVQCSGACLLYGGCGSV